MVLNSTYFKFNETIYKQIFGTPMGSPLSPIIAEIVMRDLEELALHSLPFEIPVYFRYVDDIFIATPYNKLEECLEVFNSQHDRIKFTMETNNENFNNFLNLKIMVKDNRLIFDLFTKPTASGRFLNFHSNHPITHKKGIIYGMVDRVLKLSDPDFHNKNIIEIIKILLRNSYPLKFIFISIRNRIKYQLHKSNKKNNTNNDNTKNNNSYFSIPYIKKHSDKLINSLAYSKRKIAYKCNHKLKKFIKPIKDPIPRCQNNNVVYKIQCSDCEATYIGQTKRQLRTRIKEHKQNVKKKTDTLPVITEHILNTGHNFDWDNTAIIDTESHFNKRLISESLHIKRHSHNINKKTDTELFPDIYLPILSKFQID